MATVDFLHHENPPTSAGIEPATLGAEGQRHTKCSPNQNIAIFCHRMHFRPASMVAMTLGLSPSGFGFESRVRLGCIFFGKEVGLSPEMDSRLERNSSAPLLVICWDHRL
ncbi:hypothetical protein TNCV_1946751 [Trichonephila clavipes]|nr:hypothetical protein TNCV_1946751 [Trichonephila clavipes]